MNLVFNTVHHVRVTTIIESPKVDSTPCILLFSVHSEKCMKFTGEAECDYYVFQNAGTLTNL